MALLPPIGHAFSGAAGALIALTITYPLDIIKTRLQVQSNISTTKHDQSSTKYDGIWHAITTIYKEEGIMGLYTGLPTGLLGTASSNFAYFFWYQSIRDYYHANHVHHSKEQNTTLIELALGALAGALCQITTIPVSVVITCQQTVTNSKDRLSLIQTWQTIVREEGALALWKGFIPSLILVSNPAITFGMYNRLQTLYLSHKKPNKLTSVDVFLIGAFAKTLATVVTYPYILAKTRIQYKPPTHLLTEFQYSGVLDCLLKILKTGHGLSGWYVGMYPQICKAVLSQALLFMLKDWIDKYTFMVYAIIFKTRPSTKQRLR